MKRCLLSILAISICVSIYASDVRLTATAAVHPLNNGEILIEIDQTLGNAPFTVNITSNKGYSYSQQISGYILNKLNLGPDYYCVQVVSLSGCVANACIEVKSCRFVNNTYNCTGIGEPCCPGDIIVGGAPMNPLSGNESESDFYYYWQSGVDSILFSSLTTSLQNSTAFIVNQLLLTGTTVFDTSSQTAFTDPSVKIVISYNALGQVNWVWNNLSHILPRGDKLSNIGFSIFPNPAQNKLNLVLNPGLYKSLAIIDVLGNVLFKDNIESNQSTLQINLQSYPQGFYKIILKTYENTSDSKSFIKQ